MANEGKNPMTPTLLYSDPLFLKHQPGPHHPERPERLERILDVLTRAPLPGVQRKKPTPVTDAQLASVHTPRLLAALAAHAGQNVSIDEDTVMSADSHDAALLAAGAAVGATEEVLAGRARNAFALVRPPGHHAEPDRAMGFCLYNNAAVAAERARELGAERVAILDWDVHHGNGTQAAFWGRSDVLYLSSHQFPFYPGTGAIDELGEGAGKGYTVNCPLPAGQTDADYGLVFHELFLPVLQAFRPQLLIVSAGFDAHASDPLGQMKLSERGYAAMCSALVQLAEQSCGGKVVMLLEGGYDLDALAQSVHACCEVLGGRRDDFPTGAGVTALRVVRRARELLKPHWPSLA
jgi:acetoin utilization deacetylase AcuC-like enzyme